MIPRHRTGTLANADDAILASSSIGGTRWKKKKRKKGEGQVDGGPGCIQERL